MVTIFLQFEFHFDRDTISLLDHKTMFYCHQCFYSSRSEVLPNTPHHLNQTSIVCVSSKTNPAVLKQCSSPIWIRRTRPSANSYLTSIKKTRPASRECFTSCQKTTFVFCRNQETTRQPRIRWSAVNYSFWGHHLGEIRWPKPPVGRLVHSLCDLLSKLVKVVSVK